MGTLSPAQRIDDSPNPEGRCPTSQSSSEVSDAPPHQSQQLRFVSDPCLGRHCTIIYDYCIVESPPIDLQSPPSGWVDLEGQRLGPGHILCLRVLNKDLAQSGEQ